MIQWREFLIGEISDKLRKNHNFFEGDNNTYEMSALKRIITRFEYILNTYLREFVRLSINDWEKFIKYFTNPNLNNDELWKVNDTPCIVIHLSIKKKRRKKVKIKTKKILNRKVKMMLQALQKEKMKMKRMKRIEFHSNQQLKNVKNLS